MAYLITCSKSKIEPIFPNHGQLNELCFHQTLGQVRQQLIKLTGISLNWTYTLPAWQLYKGPYSRLYPQLSVQNWTDAETDIKILSALFGWVKPTDLLPYYKLTMSEPITQTHQSVCRFWQKKNVLQQHVNSNDIDLLSQPYRKAVHGKKGPVATLPDRSLTDRGIQKGIWLEQQLNNVHSQK